MTIGGSAGVGGAPLGESGAPSRSLVTVWRIALDPHAPPPADALALLSAAERARAAQFFTDALRNRWLHAHVAMRRILARALGVAPEAIVYGAGASGKPFVASPAHDGLEFNFSDSGDLAVLAVTRAGPVGADVERVREVKELEAITARFFSAEERDAILALDEAERRPAFHRVWARKESYIKAVGDGLAHGLHRFAVTHAADDVRFVHLDGSREEAAAWRLAAIEVPEGYAAAVAIRLAGAVIEVFDHRA